MTDIERREKVRQFVNKWNGHGNEDQDSQLYWIDFLTNVVGMDNITDRVNFEKKVIVDGHSKKIDVYIPETRVLIEQKSIGKALDKKINNSGDVELTPYEQAKRYNDNLPYDEKARWIVTCNFADIWIYDMNAAVPEPLKITLEELQTKYSLFGFLVNQEQKKITQEVEISVKAGEFVGQLYDALLKEYHNPEQESTLKSLNVLCVRLVFCLYAEDAHIFGDSGSMFHDYMDQFDAKSSRKALKELFKTLNTPESERDEYDESDLSKFPYVNGGLFEQEDIEIPNFTDEIRDVLLTKASEGFDWSMISPTIFGAVFESTLNPETRRSGGMHYTSIENIHKVIDPLFLDELTEEFNEINAIQVERTKKPKLEAFQNKLAGLKWIDPACGSGNFLTETYMSIRKLENRVIRAILDCDRSQVDGQIMFTGAGIVNPIKVSISQFYGIEINDFAVTVAKTALWIAESQMMKETEDIVKIHLDFLPLKTNAYIVEGNALRMDWESVVPKTELNYLMGNPPFVGKKEQSKEQKRELTDVFCNAKGIGNADYVCGWYKKSADYIKNTFIRGALVSTNSITQGEQVPIIWGELINDISIIFAYRTFRWDSEANQKANVHCVIIGFCDVNYPFIEKRIISGDSVSLAKNINPYLVDAPTVLIENRGKSICDVPEIAYGSMPIDDGHLILEKEDRDSIIAENPDNEKMIRKYVGGKELIRGTERWCLWLQGVSPTDIRKSKIITSRVQKTAEFRQSSGRPQTLALATTPSLFGEIRQPDTNMLVIPKVSSETRRYIPICYVSPEIIVNGSALIIPGGTTYHFGVLISNVHMAWMRAVAGRMKSDYQYSGKIVYNNFPWPSPTGDQKAKIEQTAQAILDARALYPDSSLADLYDPLTMPPELTKAHTANDKAVMQAYGFDIKNMSEADCVAALMKMYQKLTTKQ